MTYYDTLMNTIAAESTRPETLHSDDEITYLRVLLRNLIGILTPVGSSVFTVVESEALQTVRGASRLSP